MPLGLDERCIRRLKEAIVEPLSRIRVNHDVFLDVESTLSLKDAERALPDKGPIAERLEKFVGEDPLFEFVFETLAYELYKANVYNSNSQQRPLSSMPEYEDLTALADRLIHAFAQLPYQYVASFELPPRATELLMPLTPYTPVPNISVVQANDAFMVQYPLPEEPANAIATLFGTQPKKSWKQDALYVQVAVEGFADRYASTTPMQETVGTFKSLIGILIGTHAMKINRSLRATPFGPHPKDHFVVHRKVGDTWKLYAVCEMPTELNATLHGLDAEDLDGRIASEHATGWIANALPKVTAAFRSNKKAEHVCLAARWLLDSYGSDNQLLSFVQTTVAMEIMLGEENKSDVIGIGELIRNRCAYLIAINYEQRRDLLRKFDDIYKVRSKIVHRGKSRLTKTERSLFHSLQWMCRRVIAEELELIMEDSE